LQKLKDDQANQAQQLSDDNAKAQRSANDKVQDIQLKAARDEADALQQHLQKLQDIRDSDWLAQQKALLDRNYTALLSLSLSKTEAMKQEDAKYQQEREKRQDATENALADLRTQLSREDRERQIAYQNKLRDDQQQYVREIAQAQQRYTQELAMAQANNTAELTDLNNKYTQQRTMADANFVHEMDLAKLTAQERINLLIMEANTARNLISQIAALGQSVSGTGPSGWAFTGVSGAMAEGGHMNAGDIAVVQERGSTGMESFGGAPFPGGMGLFMALRSGEVNSGRSGGSSRGGDTHNWYIQSNDVEGVKREVMTILEKLDR
jgi:hypothetical protein